MEQYYIAREDGEAEGPYFLESLKTFHTHGKISEDTLVCIVGSQDWVQFRKILEYEKRVQDQKRFEEARTESEKPSWQKLQEQQATTSTDVELIPTIGGLFQIVGVITLITGVYVFLYHAKEQLGIGFIYFLIGAFSCLGCFWCAKVIRLLERIAENKEKE